VLDDLKDAMVIPSEAIIPQMNGEKVFLCKVGKAKSTIILTGLRTDREVQVTNGLNPGDTVIITGLLQLREDMPVKTRISR
jgi:membrane fusion protein (multidrug efflux system)